MGQTLILDAEAKRTKVGKVLEKTFGDVNASRIMVLAYYVVCRGKALSRSGQWLEDRLEDKEEGLSLMVRRRHALQG